MGKRALQLITVVTAALLGAAATFLLRPGLGTSVARAGEPEVSGQARLLFATSATPASMFVHAITDPDTGATCYLAVVKGSGAVSIDCLPRK